MDVDILWHIETHELGSKMCGAANDFAGNNAVAHDRLVVIDITQKQIQRSDSLTETAFHMFPFGARNDARDQIEGKDPFGSFLIVIDRESHSLREKCVVCQVAFFLEFLGGHPRVASQELFIMRTDAAARIEHLVEEEFRCVSLKKIPHNLLS